MQSKEELRHEILKKRAQLTNEQVFNKSHIIIKKVIEHPFFLEATTIYTYLDYRNEVSTRLLIETAWNLNKIVAVPKIIDGNMSFYRIQSFNDLSIGTFNILEPTSNELIYCNEGLMVMPGVVFDKSCHRIGYGKGFYDRYLKNYPQLNKIALAYDLQVVNQIQSETHDINPQFLITESQIYDEKKSKMN